MLYSEGRRFMKNKLLFSILLLLSTLPAWALSELNAEFGYGRQVYGANDENKTISRTYSGSLAQYFFETTAIEFNYSYQSEISTENNNVTITGTNYSVVSMQNNIRTSVYGIGLRQALAPQKSPIRPMLSFGFAKQFVENWTDYTFKNNTTGSTFVNRDGIYKSRVDSAFAAFSLQLKMTQTFSLQGSVKTVFPAFKTGLAKNNLKYTAGFTWFF